MKNRLVNIICGLLIAASLVVIIRSVISMSQKNFQSTKYKTIMKIADFLTEIDFDEMLIDVGEISNDTIIYQSYTLRNSGAHPLIVYHVDPDCNCTNFEISKGMAMPNDSITINLTVDTKNKQIGRFMLNTVVQVNTKKQFYLLKLIGEVIKD